MEIDSIVHDLEPITLIGGGWVHDGDLEAALALAPRLVAADGGAGHAMAEGVLPEAVIGDMDSLSEGVRRALDPGALHEVREQDSTDFEKVLARVSAPLLIGVGFTGGRSDHELAALSALAARPARRCILIAREDIICACPPRLHLDLAPGTRVSLFPMAEVTGRSEGLEWPIEGLRFSPAGRIGTSNRATGPVTLEMGPGMLLILPRVLLPLLADALLGR